MRNRGAGQAASIPSRPTLNLSQGKIRDQWVQGGSSGPVPFRPSPVPVDLGTDDSVRGNPQMGETVKLPERQGVLKLTLQQVLREAVRAQGKHAIRGLFHSMGHSDSVESSATSVASKNVQNHG